MKAIKLSHLKKKGAQNIGNLSKHLNFNCKPPF